MSEPIISISGLRGIIGTELTPLVATRFAAALCATAEPGPIVLARDGRVSGPMLCDAIASTIVAHGRNCIDLDVASTPTAGFVVRSTGAAGGIQVSASHNPPPYNGMKLFGPDGRVLSAEPGKRVLEAYRSQAATWCSVDSLGKRIPMPEPYAAHLRAVLNTVDVERIRGRSFRVLLDSNHGAGGQLGAKLLEALGCTVTILGAEPSGIFAHPPEPLAENLTAVSKLAKGFDVGFCQDPDADRLAIVDGDGQFIGEEFTSVLCMKRRLMLNKGPLVTNCASSNMTRWLAQENGVSFFQSAVGEANVADCMLSQQAIYGGEGSGGPIDPRVGYIRDSFVGMAQVLDLMAATGESVAQLVASFPQMVMIKDKMSLSKEKLLVSIDTLKAYFSGGPGSLGAPNVQQMDGVRLDWNDRWILLRGSNTEPIVRLISEAPTLAEAQALIAGAKSAMGIA